MSETAFLEPSAVDAKLNAGVWELDLWSGAARFSEWFYERLPWMSGLDEKTLFDLKPFLVPGAWEVLLGHIREHLERGVPLDAELCVQLDGGRIEWWRLTGAAERNTLGHPVHLAGSIIDVSERTG
jgi:PAS domain-containing protein